MVLLFNQDTLTVSDLLRLEAVGDSLQIQEAVESGKAQVFYVANDTLLIFQIDRESLVVLAIVDSGGVAIMQTLIILAREMQLRFVWYRTQRRGMQKLLQEFHPVRFENGYRVDV